MMIVEHHDNNKKVGRMRKQLAFAGWNSSVTPAMDNDAGGTSGGAAVLWRHHLQCKAVVLGSMLEANGRAAFATRKVRGATLTIAAVYLISGKGDGPDTCELLAELGQSMESRGNPCVAFGEWNMQPAGMANTEWTQTVGCTIVPSRWNPIYIWRSHH